jgi:hypothetical protein
MNPNASDPVDPAVQYLHAANDVLDERPRPGVRDAILRAAAHANAPSRPPATAGAAVSAKSSPRSWFGWPRSVAGFATAGVAILAIGIALRVERERPPEGRMELAQTASTSMKAPPSPVPAPGPAAATEVASRARGQVTQELAQVTPDSGIPRPFPEAPSPRPAAGAGAAPAEDFAKFAANGAAPTAETSMALRADAAPVQTARSSSRALMVAADALTPYRSSAKTWIDRLIELRKSHRDREADEELALFRKAHPDEAVPSAAQRASAEGQ